MTGNDVINAIKKAGLEETELECTRIVVKLEEHISYISYGILNAETGELIRYFEPRETALDVEKALKEYYANGRK